MKSSLIAAAIAAALVAAFAVIVFSQWSNLLVWAAFIGWASYDLSGDNRQAALRSSACLVFGAAMAWAVAAVVATGTAPLSATPAAALVAGAASFLIVAASSVPILSIVPAVFYGFASTFAYASLVPGASAIGSLTASTWRNAFVAVAISLVIGTALGLLHGWLASALIHPSRRPTSGRVVRLDGSPAAKTSEPQPQ